MPTHILRFSCLLFVAFGMITEANSQASPSNRQTCGVVALYGALGLLGIEVELSELLKDEYVTPGKGSSIAQLKRAAKDHGVVATPLMNASMASLLRLSSPAILHWKSNSSTAGYNHFVLYMGSRNGNALILDAPRPLSEVSHRDLSQNWDGTAIVISSEVLDTRAVLAADRWTFLIQVAIGLGTLLFIALLIRFAAPGKGSITIGKRLKSVTIQSLVMVSAAFALSIAFHVTSDEGFLSPTFAIETENIVNAHLDSFIVNLTAEDVVSLMDSDTLVVDARMPNDYRTGHIEGAINLPPTSTQESIRALVDEYPKSTLIILYCQSASRPYAMQVAKLLRTEGFDNLTYFKGGWIEWTTYRQANERQGA